MSRLSAADRAALPANSDHVFVGFDGNHDDHYGVAHMFIENMARWGEFKERALNSHRTVLPKYRRMLVAYKDIGPTQDGLSLADLQTILNA